MNPAALRGLALLLAVSSCGAMAQVYDGPESVEYHARLDRYLVGNTGGPILTRASDGTLGLFTDATASPYGIELLGGTLFALDSGRLQGFDIDSAAPLLDFAVPGAAFLNGITSDGTHVLYVSDFSAREIHRIDVADLDAPVAGTPVSTGSATPNGLVFDRAGQRVLVATWGPDAKILALDAAGDAPATLIETNLSNIDGIALDCSGAIVVAAWGGCGAAGGCLARFEPPFALDTPFTLIAEGLSSPADIDFNRETGEIGVPESGSANTVSLHASGCEAAVFSDDFER